MLLALVHTSIEHSLGDDWLQYIRHVPNPLPVIVRVPLRKALPLSCLRGDDAELI